MILTIRKPSHLHLDLNDGHTQLDPVGSELLRRHVRLHSQGNRLIQHWCVEVLEQRYCRHDSAALHFVYHYGNRRQLNHRRARRTIQSDNITPEDPVLKICAWLFSLVNHLI